jgi:hypothetical protein
MPILKLSGLGSLTPWTKTPNLVIDKLMPGLKDTEVRVLLVLLRSTVGWNREGQPVAISYASLQARTGRSSEAISNALKSLDRQGLIHIVRKRRDKLRNIPKKPGSESEAQQ